MRKLRVARTRMRGYRHRMEPYHYALIRRAIHEIDAAPAPLTLAELAARVGLSPHHFQRLFSQWAGVSPKRYQQYLTLGVAKEALAHGAPLTEAADHAALSGTGRLHDLFITWESMTPGSWAAKGQGLSITEGTCQSPYGPVVAMATEHGLCALGFAGEVGEDATRDDLRSRWPAATIHRDDAKIAAMVEDALQGRGRLHMMGAPFHIKVWEALLAIPEGGATTYGAIAARIGKPGASRAVGTAVGRNPISAIIPCHRVLRAGGGMGGYHWGQPVKRAILAREAARRDSARTG